MARKQLRGYIYNLKEDKMFMTMRKMLLILALVLFAFAVSAAAQTEQELVSVPAVSAGFGPSLQAANMSFRLAAFAQDANGVKIPCSAMSSYAGKEFFIPRSALTMSAAELKSAYSACLTQAHTAAENKGAIKMVVPVPSAASAAGGTIRTAPTTPQTPTTTTAATATATAATSLSATELNRLKQLLRTAERRIEEVRAEEREAAERKMNEMKAEFEKKLAAATQAAAGKKEPEPKLAELEKRVRELEKENETLKNQLLARGDNPPGSSTDWDGIFQKAGLKHHVKKVVQDPQLLAAKQAAEKRISELQLRGRTSPCALLVTTPQTDMPENFSLFGGMLDVSRADCLAASADITKEMVVLAWNPLVIAGYAVVAALLAFAWPGYKALRKFLNPAGEVKIPKPPVLDMDQVRSIMDDPAADLKGEALQDLLMKTIKNPNVATKILDDGEGVWLRADSQPDLLRALRRMEAHPSLISGQIEVRNEGGVRFYWIIFRKYNSIAPGDAIKAS